MFSSESTLQRSFYVFRKKIPGTNIDGFSRALFYLFLTAAFTDPFYTSFSGTCGKAEWALSALGTFGRKWSNLTLRSGTDWEAQMDGRDGGRADEMGDQDMARITHQETSAKALID